MKKYKIDFTGYDSKYPEPGLHRDQVIIKRESMSIDDVYDVLWRIRKNRNYSRITLDRYEEL